jgi:hypothetical protein
MSGIQFVTDEKGRKGGCSNRPEKAQRHLGDGFVSESRRKEKGILYEQYRAARLKPPVRVAKYSLEIKRSARKELDALDDALFARIDRKNLTLADNPRPAGCKS